MKKLLIIIIMFMLVENVWSVMVTLGNGGDYTNYRSAVMAVGARDTIKLLPSATGKDTALEIGASTTYLVPDYLVTISEPGYYDTLIGTSSVGDVMRTQGHGQKYFNVAFHWDTAPYEGYCYFFNGYNYEAYPWSIEFYNVTFDCRGDPLHKRSMQLSRSDVSVHTYAKFTRCSFLRCGIGKVFSGTIANTCDSIRLDSCYADSMPYSNFNNVFITNSSLTYAQDAEIAIYDIIGSEFRNNYLNTSLCGEGITTDWDGNSKATMYQNIKIHRNTFEGNGHVLIIMDDWDSTCSIDSNRSYITNDGGIVSNLFAHTGDTMYNVKIRKNFFSSYGNHTIRLDGVSGKRRVIIDTTIIYGKPFYITANPGAGLYDTLNGLWTTGSTITVDTIGGGLITINGLVTSYKIADSLVDSSKYQFNKREGTLSWMGRLFTVSPIGSIAANSFAVKCSLNANFWFKPWIITNNPLTLSFADSGKIAIDTSTDSINWALATNSGSIKKKAGWCDSMRISLASQNKKYYIRVRTISDSTMGLRDTFWLSGATTLSNISAATFGALISGLFIIGIGVGALYKRSRKKY
jgi:hypothetical protein